MDLDRFADQTTIGPVGIVAILLLGGAMLVVPRRYTIVPMLLTACLMPMQQRIVVATMDFNVIRIMVLFGWLRVLFRGEFRPVRMGPLDYTLLAWAALGSAAYTLREGTLGAVVNQLGGAFDALGLYFLFRFLIRDWMDFDRAIRYTVVAAVITAIAFLREWLTGENIFYHLGGAFAYVDVRDGRFRCQGAFSHAIIAGCFWAALMPLLAAQWWRGRGARLWAVVGAGSAFFIVMATGSSTPLLAVMVGIAGGMLYLLRRYLAVLRIGALGVLCLLHLVMSKGVHHIFVWLNVIGASSGWHRYKLIDSWLVHFREWALLGTASTAHWGRMMWDLTNQYVFEAVRGGLLRFGCFLLLVFFGFRSVGEMLRWVRGDAARTAYVWGMGVSLLVHCASFFSVSYFGQIIMVWYLHLAMIGSMHAYERARAYQERYRRRAPIESYAGIAPAPQAS